MPSLPSDDRVDSTLAFLGDPYDYIQSTAAQLGSDAFQARIMLEPTICLTGPEAAELVYDEQRVQRAGASPTRLRRTLFGEGGVQTLDDEAHRHRKRLLVDLTGPEHAEAMAERFAQLWQARAQQWARVDEVVLYDEVRELLARTVLDWAAIPVAEEQIPKRTRQLASLFEHAGSLGPMHWRGRLDRWRSDRWAQALIEAVREDRHPPPDDSPLARIAHHRDLDGELLEARVAGVELLNLLRPTVAVSVYVTFVAHALHRHPGWAEGLEGEEDRRAWFVDEVRRMYPFFPAIAARVRETFIWNGYTFPEGRRVLLDLHGTNADPRAWENPHRFQPERFRQREASPYAFVPQGGGDPDTGHRCPGEAIAVALMETALRRLEEMEYTVPDQDLAIARRELPALPASGFVVAGVRPGPGETIEPPRPRGLPSSPSAQSQD